MLLGTEVIEFHPLLFGDAVPLELGKSTYEFIGFPFVRQQCVHLIIETGVELIHISGIILYHVHLTASNADPQVVDDILTDRWVLYGNRCIVIQIVIHGIIGKWHCMCWFNILFKICIFEVNFFKLYKKFSILLLLLLL